MKYLIKNGKIVNEGKIEQKDILTEDNYILKIDRDISDAAAMVIDASDNYVIPGIIDDQVHFPRTRINTKSNHLHGSESRGCRRCNLFYGNAQYQTGCTYTGFTGR